MSGGTINATAGIVSNSGNINISGGSIIASDTGMSTTSGTISITGGTITGEATGIAIGGSGNTPTLNISGGSVTGTNYAGIYIFSGTVNIGTKDGNVSTTSPNIYSKSYSLRNGGGTWNWYDGSMYGANSPTFDKAPSGTESYCFTKTVSDTTWGYKSYLEKILNITYDLNDANNVSYWNYIYGSRFNTSYDSSTQLSNLSVSGEGGWEIAYLKFSTVTGKKYNLSFDYQVPSEYSALSGYSGVGYQVLSGVPNDSDNTSQQIVGGNIPTSVQTTSKTITLSFTATGTTTYLAFNFGMAADYKTTQLKVGKIKFSIELSSGNSLGSLPNLDFGYATFNGWYVNASGGTKISSSTVPTSNTTYYAKLSPNTYKINYYSNTNYLQGKDSIVAIISGRVFYKKYDGASLAGYLYDGTWTGPLLVGETEESVTMYATDHESCANMTPGGSFEYNGKTYYYSSYGCWYSGNFNDTSGFDRTKYVVSGSDGINNSAKLAAQKLLADNTTSVSQSFVGGVTANLNANTYTRSNYTFKGWSTAPTGEFSYTDRQGVKNLISSGTLNLYAIWEPKTYSVNYYNNANYVTGKDTALLKLSGRVYYKKNDGAALVGYAYNDSGYTGPLLVSENADAVAYWSPDHESCTNLTYSGSFSYDDKTYYYSSGGCWMGGNLNDELGIADLPKYTNSSLEGAARQLLDDLQASKVSQTFVYERKGVLRSNTFSRTGYNYSGWAIAPTRTVSYSNTSTVSDMSNVTNLYAVWSAKTYYLNLDGFLDGTSQDNINGYGSVDIYVNGSLVCDDCSDYYAQHPYGSTYLITDIKSGSGYGYNGVYLGNLSGTLTKSTEVYLNFVNAVYQLSSGNVTYAYNLENAISNVSSGGTITALKDNTSAAITINKNLTLNTNSKTITMSDLFAVSGVNAVINGGGTISRAHDCIGVYDGATLTISGATIQSTVSDKSAIYVLNGTLNVENGTLLRGGYGIYADGGTTNINGGTVIGNAKEAIYTENANLNVTDGNILGTTAGVYNNTGSTAKFYPKALKTRCHIEAYTSNSAIVNNGTMYLGDQAGAEGTNADVGWIYVVSGSGYGIANTGALAMYAGVFVFNGSSSSRSYAVYNTGEFYLLGGEFYFNDDTYYNGETGTTSGFYGDGTKSVTGTFRSRRGSYNYTLVTNSTTISPKVNSYRVS